MRKRFARAAALLLATMVAAGCGWSPPTTEGGSAGSSDSNQGQEQPPPDNPPERIRYSWRLPIGDVSPNYEEKEVYDALHDSECAEAQEALDTLWSKFQSPRNVLLAQAAIGFCRGEQAKGTAMFARAQKLGFKGLLSPEDTQPRPACEYYKALSSVINQKPPSDYTCSRGEPPAWESETDPREQQQ